MKIIIRMLGFIGAALFASAQPSPIYPPVSQIIAGTNVTISPTNGRGVVTINAGASGGPGVFSSVTVNGTAGNGFLSLLEQASNPATPTNAIAFFADASNRFSWKGENGFVRTFDGNANTADRIYTLPDFAGSVALIGASSQTGNFNASNFQTINTGAFLIGAFGGISSPSDGIITLKNNAGTAFSRLQFGGTTSSFPAIVRNGTSVKIRLADDSGDASLTAGPVTGQNFNNGAGNSYSWSGRSQLDSTADGIIRLLNAAGNSFSRLTYGGSSSSFPAHKRNGATIETVLADDSGFAAGQSLYDRFGSGSPESAVTAPVGAVYHRTDGGAGTSFYVKESGTGNTGWAAK